MKEKNFIILCVILALLVGLIFFKQSMKSEVATVEEITDIIVSSVNKDNVVGIVLRLGDSGVEEEGQLNHAELVKKDDQWFVETQYGAHGSDNQINPLIEKLDKLKGELRSNSDKILGDYGISDKEAVHVEIYRREMDPIHVIVGTKKSGFQNNFVRMNGSNEVYVVEENLLGTLGLRGEGEDQKLDTDKWVDKHMLHMDVGEVVGIAFSEYKNGAEEKIIDIKQELIDDKKQWKSSIPYAFGLSATKIKRVLEAFNNTYVKEIIAPDVEGVFDAPGWIGTFSMGNKEQVKLIRGDKDGAGINYYLKREGVPYYFLIPVSTFHGRKDQQGAIFGSNPFKVEVNNIEEIDIDVLSADKKFKAIKRAKSESNEGDDAEGKSDAAKEDQWETPSGEPIEIAKIKDIINKIKAIDLEIALSPSNSAGNSMVLCLTKEGVTTKYTISNDLILETGKECRFLTIDSDTQNYCVKKSTVTALQNVLP